MEIVWNNYLWDGNHTVDVNSVELLESHLGIKFPKDYLDVVMIHQGKVPNPNQIKVGGRITSVGVLFLITHDNEYKGSTIKSNVMYVEDDLPQGIVPIVGSGGGSVFAFDFRKSSDTPSIVFVDSDKEGDDAITFLSDSFSGFLSLLRGDLT
ncbi:SMI1/KNR4 family protein [Oleiphilus messinensis]|uniref:SMI1/KNR4 family protein n=1 Tax=Oleiphilus messinensis TaxID=141451 RepID=A0A1Y0I1F0_9GAMM|nr:SMI1/KNR4 family protein [Oleiphilus messinensis]ARU54231.1 SMI1/KNR4 family protein [Oleiphilus messinensis]